MNDLLSIGAQAAGSVLLQTSVILGVGMLILSSARRASGSTRASIARVALCLSVLGVILSLRFGEPASPGGLAAPRDTSPTVPASPAGETNSTPPTVVWANPISGFQIAPQVQTHGPLLSLYQVANYLWPLGSLLVLGWTALGYARLRRIRLTATVIDDPDAAELLCDIAKVFRVKPPQLLASDMASSPFLSGVHRPDILFPQNSLETLDESELRTILTHEVAHLRRRDCLWLLMSRVVCALLWLQPLVWIMTRRLESASEDACDEASIGNGISPIAYAHSLLALSARFAGSIGPALRTCIVRPGSNLGERIRRILSNRTKPPKRSGAAMLASRLCLFTAAAAAALAWPVTVRTQIRRTTKVTASKQTGHFPVTPLAFEGLEEKSVNGFAHRREVQYDRGNYRVQYLQRRSRGGPFFPASISLFDGRVSWDLDPDRRIARPSRAAVENRLAVEAKTIGEEAVRRKYGLLPVVFSHNLANSYAIENAVDFPHLFSDQERMRFTPSGWGNVSGIRCRKYEYRYRPHAWSQLSSDGKSLEGEFPFTERVWVDPNTNLVQRWEHRDERGKIGNFPPMTITRRMLTFRLRRSLPAATFQLPPGTTAILPEVFRGFSLPAGVHSKETPGIGIRGVTRPDVENTIRHETVRKELARGRMELALARGDERRAEIERGHIRRIDELVMQLRERLVAKPLPLPPMRK